MKIFVATGAFMVAMVAAMLFSAIRYRPHLAAAVVFGRDGRDPRRAHHLASQRDVHQDEADASITRWSPDLLAFGLVDRPAAAPAACSDRPIPGLDEDGWPKLTRNWAIFFAGMAVAQRSRVAQQLDRFLDRLQDVGRDPAHLPVRRRQHADAAEARPDARRRRASRAGTGRMSDPILSIRGLRKDYGTGVDALKSVDLDIRRGEIFALLGPNGAGKTTLINIVCGIVTPSGGEVLVDGKNWQSDYRHARERIGLVPQELTTEAFESVWSTVNFSRGLFGKPRNDGEDRGAAEAPVAVGQAQDRMMHLSGGMKRRVMIAKALSHEPDILFLDEPTAGVDVELRRDMWDAGAQAARRRHDDHPHHPLHRGSRGDGRPRRRDQPRRADRGRREDVADGQDGQEDARHHARRAAGRDSARAVGTGTSGSNMTATCCATSSTAMPSAPASPR